MPPLPAIAAPADLTRYFVGGGGTFSPDVFWTDLQLAYQNFDLPRAESLAARIIQAIESGDNNVIKAFGQALYYLPEIYLIYAECALLQIREETPAGDRQALYQRAIDRLQAVEQLFGQIVSFWRKSETERRRLETPLLGRLRVNFGDAYRGLGQVMQSSSHMTQARSYYQQALSVLSQGSDYDKIERRALAERNLGEIALFLEEYDEAARQLSNALTHAQGFQDRVQEWVTQADIASLLVQAYTLQSYRAGSRLDRRTTLTALQNALATLERGRSAQQSAASELAKNQAHPLYGPRNSQNIGILTALRYWTAQALMAAASNLAEAEVRTIAANVGNRFLPRRAGEPDFQADALRQKSEQVRFLETIDRQILIPLATEQQNRPLAEDLLSARAENYSRRAMLYREMSDISHYVQSLREALTRWGNIIQTARGNTQHRAILWKAKLLALAANQTEQPEVQQVLQEIMGVRTPVNMDDILRSLESATLQPLESQISQPDLQEELRFLRGEIAAIRASRARDRGDLSAFITLTESALNFLGSPFSQPIFQARAQLIRAQLATAGTDEIENPQVAALVARILGSPLPTSRQALLETIASSLLDPLTTTSRGTYIQDSVDLARAENLALRTFQERTAAPTSDSFRQRWNLAILLAAELSRGENPETQASAKLWVAKLALFALGDLHRDETRNTLAHALGMTIGSADATAERQILENLESNYLIPSMGILREKSLEEAKQVHGEILVRLARIAGAHGNSTEEGAFLQRAVPLLESASRNGWRSTQAFAFLLLGQIKTESAGTQDEPEQEQLEHLRAAQTEHLEPALALMRPEQRPIVEAALIQNLFAQALLLQRVRQPYEAIIQLITQKLAILKAQVDPELQARARMTEASLISVLLSEIDDPIARDYVASVTGNPLPPVIRQPGFFRDHAEIVAWQLHALERAETLVDEAGRLFQGSRPFDAQKQRCELWVAKIQLLLARRNVPQALQNANTALAAITALEAKVRHSHDRAEVSAIRASLLATLLSETEGKVRVQAELHIPAGTESTRDRETFVTIARLLDQATASGFLVGELGRWYHLQSAELWTRALAIHLDYEGASDPATRTARERVEYHLDQIGSRGSRDLQTRRQLLRGRFLLLTAQGDPDRLREAAELLKEGLRERHFDRFTSADILLRLAQALLQISYTTLRGKEADEAIESLDAALQIIQGGPPPTEAIQLLEAETLLARGDAYIVQHEFEKAKADFARVEDLLTSARGTEWTNHLRASATRGRAEVERYHEFEFSGALTTYGRAESEICGSTRRTARILCARSLFGTAETHRAAWDGGRNFPEAEQLYQRALQTLDGIDPPTQEILILQRQIRMGLEKSQRESSARLEIFTIAGSQRTAAGLEMTIPISNRTKLYVTDQFALAGTPGQGESLNVAGAGVEFITGGRERGSLSLRFDPLRFAGNRWMPSATAYADYQEIVSVLLAANPQRDYSDPRELKLQSTLFWRPFMLGSTRSRVALRDITLGAEATHLPDQEFAFFSALAGYALRPFDREWEAGVELRVPVAMAPRFRSVQDSMERLPWRLSPRFRYNPSWLPVDFELQLDLSQTRGEPRVQGGFFVHLEDLF